MRVTISDDAKADLRSIAAYISRENPRRAGLLVRELRAQCASIGLFPQKHQLVPGYEAAGLRRLAQGNYVIFFHIDRVEVVVIRVLHGARDIDRLLSLDPRADNDQ